MSRLRPRRASSPLQRALEATEHARKVAPIGVRLQGIGIDGELHALIGALDGDDGSLIAEAMRYALDALQGAIDPRSPSRDDLAVLSALELLAEADDETRVGIRHVLGMIGDFAALEGVLVGYALCQQEVAGRASRIDRRDRRGRR
jgi:hypothetical protein